MSILPEGEELRNAVKWISEKRKENSKKSINQLIETACLKFDLPPKDAEFLSHFYKEKEKCQK